MKIRYIILAVLLALAVFLFLRMGLPYIRRHYQPVHVREAELISGEKAEMEGRSLTRLHFEQDHSLRKKLQHYEQYKAQSH